VKIAAIAAALSFIALVACTTNSDPEPATESNTAEALSGCHQVCPHCPNKPGTECPLAPCYLKCSDPQGHDVCPDNEMCIQGYAWQPNACKCAPSH
jgi:hypothetical protein